MKAWLLSVSLAICPYAAYAQSVAIRSGEHEGFSRLVLSTGPVSDWVIERTATGATVLVPGAQGFDLSRVYERIPRDRLTSVSSKDAELLLEFDCSCDVEGFLFERNQLVIDIRDSPKESASAEVASIVEPQVVDPPKPRRPILPIMTERAAEVPMPMPIDLDQFRRALTASLARASAQGLVVADTILAEPPAEKREMMAEPGRESRPEVQLADHLRVTTQVDIDNPDIETVFANNNGADCPTPSLITHPNGQRVPFVEAVSKARLALSGEFDRENPDAIDALLRAYLDWGFGAEAVAIFERRNNSDEHKDLMIAIANMMENPDGAHPFLANFVECDAPISLWAALASSADQLSVADLPGSLLETFSGLTLELRRHIGPSLIEKLVQAGKADLAGGIQAAIARSGGPHGSGFDLASISLSEVRGSDPEKVITDLREIAQREDALSLDAYLRLLGEAVASEQSIDGGIIAAAAGHAFELRGTDKGAELSGLILQARALSGDPTGALRDARRSILAQDRDLVNWVAMKFATQTDDPDLLRGLYELDLFNASANLSPDVIAELASRLVELDLPDLAEDILGDRALESVATRVSAARLALKRKKPTEALVLLADLTDPSAELLVQRAEALRQTQAETQGVQTAAPAQPDRKTELPLSAVERAEKLVNDAAQLRSEISENWPSDGETVLR